MAAVDKEAEEAVKQQKEIFGLGSNTPPDENLPEDKKKAGAVNE